MDTANIRPLTFLIQPRCCELGRQIKARASLHMVLNITLKVWLTCTPTCCGRISYIWLLTPHEPRSLIHLSGKAIYLARQLRKHLSGNAVKEIFADMNILEEEVSATLLKVYRCWVLFMPLKHLNYEFYLEVVGRINGKSNEYIWVLCFPLTATK